MTASRRALLVAPTYDGEMFGPLPGAAGLLGGLESILASLGGYEVQRLTGEVDERGIRTSLSGLFDTDGEVLLYFYGHGTVRWPGATVLCRSQAVEGDEGFQLSELVQMANGCSAREVVMIVDCCHSGNLAPPSSEVLRRESASLLMRPGAALLASCMASQQSHVEDGDGVSRFSGLALEGLEGPGRLPNSNVVSVGSLFLFLTEKLTRWGQDPVLVGQQTGLRGCHIVRHPDTPPSSADEVAAGGRRFGLPFAPSISFVGREAEIDFLRAFLCGTDKPLSLSATVEGLGGIGKTELVLQLLHDHEVDAAFPSMLWFDASAPLAPQWAYFAEQVGLETEVEEVATVLVESLRERGRVLVVLDNAGGWQEIKEQVPAGVSLIATTRSRAFGDSSFVRQELGTLSEEAAESFLATMLPDADRPALAQIAQRLGGHVLALEIAGHYIRDQCSPSEYLERLEGHEEGDAAASAANRTHYGKTLTQCLQISWDGLRSDAARELWLRAALFAPVSAHRELLRALAVRESAERLVNQWEFRTEEGNLLEQRTIPESEFAGVYQELRDVHILARVDGYNGDRWAMHRLVRDFARSRLAPGDMTLHAATLAEWLRQPTLPIEPEAPHIVSAILDLPRFGTTVDPDMLGSRLQLRGWGYSRSIFGDALIGHLGNETRSPQAISLIFEGIADLNADVRIQAIRMMEELGPVPEVKEALTRILDDPSPVVRGRAAISILEHGTWSSRAMLDHALATSPRATDSVLKALGGHGSAESKELLQAACKRLSGAALLEAAIQLGGRGGPEAKEVLLPALVAATDREEYRRIRNSLKSTPTGQGEVAAALREVAWGERLELALSAAVELAKLGDVEAARRILEIAPDLGSGRADSTHVAAAIAAAEPGMLAEAGAFLSETTIQWAIRELAEEQLRRAVAQLREHGAGDLAESAAKRLAEVEGKRREKEEREARKQEAAERIRRIQQAGGSDASKEGEYDLPSPDSWSQWSAEIDRSDALAREGVVLESPRAAWRRVFADEMAGGASLPTAQARAKVARDEAAAALAEDSAGGESR